MSRKPAPPLDPRTLRAIASELAEARDQYADFVRRLNAPNTPTSRIYVGKVLLLRDVIRRLRNRASRIEGKQKRGRSAKQKLLRDAIAKRGKRAAP